MKYDITTIDQLIKELGGASAVGEWLGITQEAVSNWKIRRHIPPGWHWKLAAELARRNRTVDPAVFGVDENDVPFLTRVA